MDKYRIQFVKILTDIKPNVDVYYSEIKESNLLSDPDLLECRVYYRQDDLYSAFKTYFYPTQESIQEKAEYIARRMM